jgi:hypothetical protein
MKTIKYKQGTYKCNISLLVILATITSINYFIDCINFLERENKYLKG